MKTRVSQAHATKKVLFTEEKYMKNSGFPSACMKKVFFTAEKMLFLFTAKVLSNGRAERAAADPFMGESMRICPPSRLACLKRRPWAWIYYFFSVYLFSRTKVHENSGFSSACNEKSFGNRGKVHEKLGVPKRVHEKSFFTSRKDAIFVFRKGHIGRKSRKACCRPIHGRKYEEFATLTF